MIKKVHCQAYFNLWNEQKRTARNTPLPQFGHEKPYNFCLDGEQTGCRFTEGVAGYAEEK